MSSKITIVKEVIANKQGEAWNTLQVFMKEGKKQVPILLIRGYAASSILHGKFSVIPCKFEDIGDICDNYEIAAEVAAKFIERYLGIKWSPEKQ